MKKILAKSALAFCLLFSGGCSAIKTIYNDKNDLDNHSDKLVQSVVNKVESLSSEQKEIIFKYAPVIFQNTNKKTKHELWDFMTSFDFDGDMKANNNEASLISNKFKLPATLYYSIVESETHYFITYSLYHPLDWDTLPSFVPYTWHENDMENIQIVVRKKSEYIAEGVVLIATQAHLNTKLLTVEGSSIKAGTDKKLSQNEVLLLTEDLKENGTHPAIFTESGGHGIHSINSSVKNFSQLKPLKLKEGFTFTPAKNNIAESYSENNDKYQYQLKSTYDTFWAYYLSNTNIGRNKLINGSFNYKDDLVECKNLPRFFTSSRVSGPWKSDSGILPFAFSDNLLAKDLGAIFFNPAKKYKSTLRIRGKWSKNYVYNPYITDLAKVINKKIL